MTTHNGVPALELDLTSGSFEFTSETSASFSLTDPDTTEYVADKGFDVLVTVPANSTNVKIVGETGAAIGTLSSSVVTSGNTKVWTISIKVGSKGNRTLTALGAAASGGYGTAGKSFNISIQ